MSDGSSEIEKTFVQEFSASSGDGFESGQIVVEKYKIVSLLGRGGIGSVYKVEQIFLGQSFALKTLNSQKATDQLIRRFQNEARAASSLSHANLVKVLDFGLLDGQQPYLVMDLVEGLTLSEYLKKNGPLSLEQAVGCFTQVCLGLSYAHDQGIIHRDIKPSNVMIFSDLPFGAEGFVKVVDFGIAKLAYTEDGEAQSLTTTGEVFGSPLYMSPEQCSGQGVDHRTDIYSLGCVLFESLTGTTPFVGQSALTTMMLHQSEPAPSLKEASLGKEFPPELEQIVLKMLAKAPSDRYQNLGIVANDLAQVFKGAPVLGVTSDKEKNKTDGEPLKMSRRELQVWLLLAVLGSGLIGVAIGYYLAKVQLEKNELQKSNSAVVAPSESSKKGISPPLFEGMKTGQLKEYDPMFEAADKVERDDIARNFIKEYEAARATIDKAAVGDKVSVQRGLDQFITLQKKAQTIPEMDRKFGSPIEERIAFCEMRLGRYAEAEKHLRRARNFAVSLEQEGAVAVGYQEMAGRALLQKCYQDSFNYYLIAAQIGEKISNTPDCKPELKQAASSEAGNSYRCCCAIKFQYLNDYKSAIALGEKAIKLLMLTKENYLLGATFVSLGVAYSRDNKLVPARKYLSAAEKYLIFPNLLPDAPLIRSNGLKELAAVEFGLGDSKKALEHARRALKVLGLYKSVNRAQQKGIDFWHDQLLEQIKVYESAVSAGKGASPTASASTPVPTSESK